MLCITECVQQTLSRNNKTQLFYYTSMSLVLANCHKTYLEYTDTLDLFRVIACRTCHVEPWASCQIRKIADAHAHGMLGTFSTPPRISNPDMHHGHVRDARAVMHAGIANSRFSLNLSGGGKRSRHSRRMRNPQFYVSGKRPMDMHTAAPLYVAILPIHIKMNLHSTLIST